MDLAVTHVVVAITTSFEFRSGQFCIPHSGAQLPEIWGGSRLQRPTKKRKREVLGSQSISSLCRFEMQMNPFGELSTQRNLQSVCLLGYRGNAFSLNVIAIMTRGFVSYTIYLNWYNKKRRTSHISLSSREKMTVQKIARLSWQVVGHLFCDPSLVAAAFRPVTQYSPRSPGDPRSNVVSPWLVLIYTQYVL